MPIRLKAKYAFPLVSMLIPLCSAVLTAQENGLCFECHNDPGLTSGTGDSLYVDSERYAASVHGRMELECIDCHQDLAGFEDWPHPRRLERVDCGVCHDEPMSEWETGVHGLPARQRNDLDAAGCEDCHGSHYILPADDPASRVYPSNLPHTCLSCHGDTRLEGKHEGMGQAEKAVSYLNSAHGQALEKRGLIVSATCSSCHGSHKISPLTEFDLQIPKICGNCHGPIYHDYLQGVHGSEYLQGNADVPICTDCHGEHNILGPDNPESRVNPRQVGAVCSRCHEDKSLSSKYGLPLGRLDSYLESYHGVALELGDLRVANCASCHGFHDIRPSSDPESSIYPDNLAGTCGNCHPNAGENFAVGKIHVQDERKDNLGAWLVKKAYVLFISGLIGGFVAFIIVDLIAHRRRSRRARKEEDPGEEES
ncbi:MAG: cytochrome c3 family protein [Candidatus Glassbacteria bacterium]|nr:cytochrome c3 family protein [Candidatus Glassbacteria bacterium]